MSVNNKDTPSHEICRHFGAGTPVAHETISVLSHELTAQPENGYFLNWQELRFNATLCDHSVWIKSRDQIANKMQMDSTDPGTDKNQTKNSSSLLFAIETYFAMILRAFLRRIGQSELEVVSVYRWPTQIGSMKTRSIIESLAESINNTVGQLVTADSFQRHKWDDLFGNLYASLIPATTRKQLGEFYTPAWLADHLLDVAGVNEAIATGQNIRVLDPACGSGTFLLASVRRMLKSGMMPERIVQCVAGFDFNPLAVLMSVANLSLALAIRDGNDTRQLTKIPLFHITCHDSIRNTSPFAGMSTSEAVGQFDFVIGNPPWLAWDKLPPYYREQTKPLWSRYDLFNLSGKDARYGGAKKELALLMVMTASDHFLKTGGRLAMVLPQTVFQTHKTGNGFRRFGGDNTARSLKVLRVDDFSAMRVFSDTTTKTATLVLEKGKPTTYPVPYFCWQTPIQCRPRLMWQPRDPAST